MQYLRSKFSKVPSSKGSFVDRSADTFTFEPTMWVLLKIQEEVDFLGVEQQQQVARKKTGTFPSVGAAICLLGDSNGAAVSIDGRLHHSSSLFTSRLKHAHTSVAID